MPTSPIETKRHSYAHIMAAAILRLYPKTLLGIGPVIENGFYYDIDATHKFTPEDLPKIEAEMRKIIAEKPSFKKRILAHAEALKLFKHLNQPYKLELIKDLKKEGAKTSIFETGDFTDLCKGPHVKSATELSSDSFRLTKIAGAYWKGSEKNKQLQRIYGLAFNTKKELDEHIALLAEAERRDHRKIGKDLELFVFDELVGKGLPLWTERGATIRRELERFIVEEEIKRGYIHVMTPDIANVKLYETSGHYPYYKDSMYPAMTVDDDRLILRPMTCPHHFVLFKSKPRSYRELPMRIAELAKLYRYEKSGELTGLIRLRNFCLADSHIFATEDQASQVVNEVLDLIEYANGILGFQKGKDYTYRLSLGNRKNTKKYYKNDRLWTKGEKTLRDVLKGRKEEFIEAKGEAAFYGPKIDIQIKNVLGKEDTAFTVQYDFCLPERFALKYIDNDGKERRPIVIHRSSIGAVERTLAFMLEKHAGVLPLWLAPVQAAVIPVSEKFAGYGKRIFQNLRNSNIRTLLSDANETLGKRIRAAELQKIPYIIVVGEKEESAATVAVRSRDTKQQEVLNTEEFIKRLLKEISDKKHPT